MDLYDQERMGIVKRNENPYMAYRLVPGPPRYRLARVCSPFSNTCWSGVLVLRSAPFFPLPAPFGQLLYSSRQVGSTTQPLQPGRPGHSWEWH